MKLICKQHLITVVGTIALLCSPALLVQSIAAHIEHNSATSCSSTLFSQTPQGDLYWKALMHLAKNNKAMALEIVSALKTNNVTRANAVLPASQPGSIDECFDDLFVTLMSHDPQALSVLGLFESIGIRDHNAYLNDVSPVAFIEDFNRKKLCLERLKGYSLDTLSAEQQISYKIIYWMFDREIQGEKFLFHEYKINQLFGILSYLTLIFFQLQQLDVPEDVENYLLRLRRIPDQLGQAIDLMTYQKDRAIYPPAFALQKVITRIQNLLSPVIADNIFYKRLAACIDKVHGVNKDDVLQQAQLIIQTHVYPALKLLQEHCQQLLTSVHSNHGVWALPAGDEYYAFMLKQHTTTNLSADEIHELGLQEVARIQHEMRILLAREGVVDAQKEVGELMQQLAQNDRFYFPQSDEGRQQCLAQYEAILARCRSELYPLFDLKPTMQVMLQAVPKEEEEGQPQAYYLEPSIDGSRPGIFFANLRNMKEVPTYGMETLVMHEAEPGHHFQIALQQAMNIPILRKIGMFTAYVEGWALYAETLAYEHGFYSSSFSRLGHLQAELLRAARLVVDTGIHKKRWTREQAITYMLGVTGMHKDEIITEVERYFVLPGQACAYKVGQLKILELRNRAQQALGEKFDIREFHNVVLTLGAAPLTILEECVGLYIQQITKPS